MDTLFDRISSFLPLEHLSVFIQAEQLLQGVGYTDHELDLEEADVGLEESNDIIASITYRYTEHLERYLSGLGVWLNAEESHRLDHLIQLAEACTVLTDPLLVDVSLTLDPEAVDANERLISALVHINDLTLHQLRSLIGFTDGRLLDAYTGIERIEPYINEGEEAGVRLKQAISANESGPALDFIRTRGRLPIHFKASARALYVTLNDLTPKEAIRQWHLLALASEHPTEALEDILSQAIEQYVDPELHPVFYRELTLQLGNTHDPV